MTFDYYIEKDNGEEVKLEVTYKMHGIHRPATRLEPEEFPELEVTLIVNAETGGKVELSQAEYQEVTYKAEEYHTNVVVSDIDDRADYEREMQKCRNICDGGW